VKESKPLRLTIGLGLIAFSFIWGKLGILIGFVLKMIEIPTHIRDILPITPWQLYLTSWVIGLIGILIAGSEGWLWVRNKTKYWIDLRKKKSN
jgi:hypothetical protein